MAHAYTTKRGKNKLGKLGVRKDQQSNQERDLKVPSSISNKYEHDKVNMGSVVGNIQDSMTRLRLSAAVAETKAAGESSHATEQVKSHTDFASTGAEPALACGSPLCTKDPLSDSYKLLGCSSCQSVKYCCKECQLSHWSTHRADCKIIKLKMKEDALGVVAALNILQSERK